MKRAREEPPPAVTPWMDRLWEVHCGGPLAGTVRYTDPVVEEMWSLFQPLLIQLRLFPLKQSDTAVLVEGQDRRLSSCLDPSNDKGEEDDGAFATSAPPLTSVLFLPLHSTAAEAGYPVTPAMRAALQEQPHIALALLEFFTAVMEYRRKGGAARTEARAVGATALPSDEEETEPEEELQHVYAVPCCDAQQGVSFDQIGAAQLGRLLTVRGTIVRLSPSRIVCRRLPYRCGLCGIMKEQVAEDGILIYPGPCPTPKCRGYKWIPVTEQAICEEVQLIRLQEYTTFFDASSPSQGGGGGGVNALIEVEVRHPWLDAVTVGDGVCVTGVLDTRRTEGKGGSGMQQVCLRARALTSLRGGNGGAEGSASTWVGGAPVDLLRVLPLALRRGDGDLIGAASIAADGWTAEESAGYYEMARHPQWFSRLTHAMAPSIFGLTYVKEAMLLALVGGNGGKASSRSSIHVLMVGDPGLGKSQLLRAACAVAPRSAFVCAHTSSSCGLTMTLSRDPVSGETTFEAGAVVHGDGGVTCLDEIDKGVQEHKALLEVMEQETVSLAKAGMIFSMPVRTSLLAAGNPIGGRFDVGKTLSANLNLSPALLSRFDIIVCLRNPHGSGNGAQQLTEHILQWHRRTGGEEGGAPSTAAPQAGPLPMPLVQRFLAFAKAQCLPLLTEEACAVLRAHYLAERAKSGSAAATTAALSSCTDRHVTPRYLQALIRVSEARAKLELRHEVTAEDATYAVSLLQNCLHSFDGLTAAGETAAAGGGAGAKKPSKVSQRDAILNKLKAMIVEENGGVNLFTEQAILDVCEEAGCRSAPAMLRQLNEYGFLLQKSGSKYSVRGA